MERTLKDDAQLKTVNLLTTYRRNKMLTNIPRSLTLPVILLLILATPALANDLPRELARARAATSKYHDVAAAEADGYQFDSCHAAEACHWFNWDLYDETFDPERPEALLYVHTPNDGWRLVGVEYVVFGDFNPPPPAPEGFTGDADASNGDEYGWRYFTEGYRDWELTAWLWLNNPNGMFAMENPRLGDGEEH